MTVTRKRAADIMIPIDRYPYVKHSATIREAVIQIENSSLEIDGRQSLPRALLVFDEESHLLGIVRRRDILRGLEPKFLRTMPMPRRKLLFDVEIQSDPDLVDLTAGRIAGAMREQAKGPVSEIMQPISATVDHDDHLAKIVYRMLSQNISLLPVLRGDEVVGVVRSVDVFRVVADLLLRDEGSSTTPET